MGDAAIFTVGATNVGSSAREFGKAQEKGPRGERGERTITEEGLSIAERRGKAGKLIMEALYYPPKASNVKALENVLSTHPEAAEQFLKEYNKHSPTSPGLRLGPIKFARGMDYSDKITELANFAAANVSRPKVTMKCGYGSDGMGCLPDID